MAINKVLETTTLSIEVLHGEDKTGAATYKKKNFSGIRKAADNAAIYAVSEAIKSVLAKDTRFAYLNESSRLTEEA